MDIIDENTLIGLSNGSVDPENVSIQEQTSCSIPVVDKEGNVYDLRQYLSDIVDKGSIVQRVEESTINPPYKPEVNPPYKPEVNPPYKPEVTEYKNKKGKQTIR